MCLPEEERFGGSDDAGAPNIGGEPLCGPETLRKVPGLASVVRVRDRSSVSTVAEESSRLPEITARRDEPLVLPMNVEPDNCTACGLIVNVVCVQSSTFFSHLIGDLFELVLQIRCLLTTARLFWVSGYYTYLGNKRTNPTRIWRYSSRYLCNIGNTNHNILGRGFTAKGSLLLGCKIARITNHGLWDPSSCEVSSCPPANSPFFCTCDIRKEHSSLPFRTLFYYGILER